MENKKTIEILSEPSTENPFIIIFKPRGLPSAPLATDDDSALTQVVEQYPEIKNIIGKKEIEYGLIHRIDTETSGLLLIAYTQQAYDTLTTAQRENNYIKKYTACCERLKQNEKLSEGFPINSNDRSFDSPITVRSSFRPFGLHHAEVRPVVPNAGKAALKKSVSETYETMISFLHNENSNDHSLVNVECTITKGYRHQVRCHLAWIGLPVKGDKIYNPQYQEPDFLHFIASEIAFPHPLTKTPITFSLRKQYYDF